MKYTRAFLVLAILLLIPAAFGDDATKAAQIDEIFRLTKMDGLQKQIVDQVKSMAPSFMAESGVPVDAQEVGQQLADRIAELCERELTWDKLKPAYSKLYDETFSEEEVSAILAFYRTPAGQALVNKTPLMMKQSVEILKGEIATLMPQVNELTREYLEKYQKEHNVQPKPEETPKK